MTRGIGLKIVIFAMTLAGIAPTYGESFESDPRSRFVAFDKEMREALKRENPIALAFLVHFPLRINETGYSVIMLDNAAALQSHFSQLFPPDFCKAILEEKPDDLGCISGKIMYAHGRLYVDCPVEADDAYQITVINTLESRSQSKVVRTVDTICNAEKHKVVVDSINGEAFRYRAWNKPKSVTDKPDMEVTAGSLSTSGTGVCMAFEWSFPRGDTIFKITKPGSCSEEKDVLEVSVAGEVKNTWPCK